MNGTIRIESKKNFGTTVTVTIPFDIANSDEIIGIVDCDSISVEGMHAMLVEDNELNMEIARFIIEGKKVKEWNYLINTNITNISLADIEDINKVKDYYNEGDYDTIETVIINYVNDDENYKSDDIYITNVGFLHDLKYIE